MTTGSTQSTGNVGIRPATPDDAERLIAHVLAMTVEAARWLSAWEARPERPWRLSGPRIEGGTHAANAPDAYRQGLRLLFGADASP